MDDVSRLTADLPDVDTVTFTLNLVAVVRQAVFKRKIS